MTIHPPSPERGDGLLIDTDEAARCDVVVYTQAWGLDSPAEPGESPNAMFGARVFVNGREIERAAGAKLIANYGFLTVDVRLNPSTFQCVPLDQEAWNELDTKSA